MAVTDDSAKLVKHFIYDGLDLTAVRALAERTYGWDGERTRQAERAYRDFLWVCWNFGRTGEKMAWISVLSDQMWHCHMQLPAAYLAATEEIFGKGYVIDHTPVMPNGQRVCERDEAAARKHYVQLGLPVPVDLRDVCIWAVVRF